MLTKQLYVDGALTAGLLAALSVVFVADRATSPASDSVALANDEPQEKGTLIHPGDRKSGSYSLNVPKKADCPDKSAERSAEQPLRASEIRDEKRHAQSGEPAQDRPANEGGNRKPRANSIYAERVAENREEVVRKRGGSQISERAVKIGLDWLARHQASEGCWANTCLGNLPGSRCERPGGCLNPGGNFSIAHTGLALLAFQGGGHFWFNDSEYSPNVKRGLDWLVAGQRPDGCLVRKGGFEMYEHAIGTFALAEACATAKHSDEPIDPKLHAALRYAVRFIEEYQDPTGGGWRYAPKQPGDTSVSGWVVLALKTAKEADVTVDAERLKRCISFFERCEVKQTGRTGYIDNVHVHTDATTGVGMLVHHFLLEKSDSPFVKNASQYLANYAKSQWGNVAGAPNYYLWYNCTLGMYLAGGDEWNEWNNIVRKRIEELQSKSDRSCERGSWPPNGDPYGGMAGRIYSTSLAILTLEVYYRFAKKTGKGGPA